MVDNRGGGNPMESRYLKFLFTFIALMLALLVIHQYQTPPLVHAQNAESNLYIEPGYLTLRSPDGLTQVQGKMVVNLNNGEVWGFPTLTNGPYPVDLANSKPPVSQPMYLGQFDFSAMKRTR
jgi:hypothetical protein